MRYCSILEMWKLAEIMTKILEVPICSCKPTDSAQIPRQSSKSSYLRQKKLKKSVCVGCEVATSSKPNAPAECCPQVGSFPWGWAVSPTQLIASTVCSSWNRALTNCPLQGPLHLSPRAPNWVTVPPASSTFPVQRRMQENRRSFTPSQKCKVHGGQQRVKFFPRIKLFFGRARQAGLRQCSPSTGRRCACIPSSLPRHSSSQHLTSSSSMWNSYLVIRLQCYAPLTQS